MTSTITTPRQYLMDSPEVINAIKSAKADLIQAANIANRGFSVAANRTHYPFNGFSAGTAQAQTFRTAHFTRKGNRVTFPRLVYANASLTATGETSGLNTYTVKSSIEYNGAVYPVFFGGSRTRTVAIDELVVSDPVNISIPADTPFHVRQYVTVPVLGDKWPLRDPLVTAIGETYSTSDRTDDVTTMSLFAASGFGPAAILGSIGGEAANVIITGSSSGYGQGDTQEAPYYDFGYLSRACRGAGLDYSKLTRASTTILHFLTTQKRQLEFIERTKPTHFIQQLGSNDISNGGSFATVQARMVEMWDILGSTGAKVYQCTATPNSTSSDSWATLANQTINANNSTRVALNEWIRSKPAGIAGYIECCDFVESSRNSGKWAVDGTANKYTADGLHLTNFAHVNTAASIDLMSIFRAG